MGTWRATGRRAGTLVVRAVVASSLAAAPVLAAPPAPSPTAAPAMPAPVSAPAPVAANDLSDGGWSQLLGQGINVRRTDGIYVYGQLLSFDAAEVTILGSDGYARKVPRNQVFSVELLSSAQAPPAQAQPQAVAPPPPGKPPIVDHKRHKVGKGLTIAGAVVMFVGFGTFFGGFLVSLELWDTAPMLYMSMPGIITSFALGMPMLIAGAGMMKQSRSWTLRPGAGPSLVLRGRRGQPRLELGPAGLRF